MSRKLEDLLPETRQKVETFLSKVEQDLGIKLAVVFTYRSWDEQDELYAQGRTTPGKIVTKAKGGESWHNFRRAVDVVPKDANGNVRWDTKDEVWKQIAVVGKACGLAWGGDFKGFPDKPHFQDVPEGYTLAKARAEFPRS